MPFEGYGSRSIVETWTFADQNLEVVRAGPVDSTTTLVLVHGVCHGAWCWHHFIGFFADRGYDTVAMSLRGHGASSGRAQLHKLRLADYVDDVLHVIERLGRRPVILGHSMGGSVVQRYLAEHAGTVSAAILFASATAGGLGGSRFLDALRGNGTAAVFNALRIAAGRPGGSGANDTPFFSNRLSPQDATRYGRQLGPESWRAVRDLLQPFERVPPDLPPIMVIGSRDDGLFGEKSQRTTAQLYGVAPVLLDGPCHDMMLDPEWQLPAHHVHEFLQMVANTSADPTDDQGR